MWRPLRATVSPAKIRWSLLVLVLLVPAVLAMQSWVSEDRGAGAEDEGRNEPLPPETSSFPENPTEEPPPAEPVAERQVFRVAVKGDWGAGTAAQHAVTSQMCQFREWQPFDYVLTTGDNFYFPDGVATEQNYFAPEWCLYSREGHVWRAAWGNHDYPGYSTTSVLGSPDSPAYFSWSAEGVDFFVYDGSAPSEAQRLWLAGAVCSSTANTKVIYGHQAPFSVGPHGSISSIQHMVHAVARDCGVQLVLSGHDHLYLRTSPVEGVTYVVTGGGGAVLYACQGWSDWVALCLSQHHFLYLEFDGETIFLRAIGTDGELLDEISIPPRSY